MVRRWHPLRPLHPRSLNRATPFKFQAIFTVEGWFACIKFAKLLSQAATPMIGRDHRAPRERLPVDPTLLT